MEKYIRFVVAHPWMVVCATLGATVVLGVQLPKLRLDIRWRSNVPEDHPYVRIQTRVGDLFGEDLAIVIGAAATRGSIFTPEFLGKIYRLCQRLYDTEGVVSTNLLCMGSPVVKTITTDDDDSLQIRPLMEAVPLKQEEVEELRRRVEEDRFLRQHLISADATVALIAVEFDGRLTEDQIVKVVKEILAVEQDDSIRFALAGPPVLVSALREYTASIGILLPVAVVIIGLVHFEAFRTLQGMILPLVTALLSVVWSLGLLGLTRSPLDTWSAITPVIILAIAAGHAVQLLKRYYEEYELVGDNREAVVRSVSALGPVMVVATLIAAVGFASLATFGIRSVRVFGMLMAGGILSALIIELSFTPACRVLLPAPRLDKVREIHESRWLNVIIVRLTELVVRGPHVVLGAGIVAFVIAAIGATQIEANNSFRNWFPASSLVRRDDAFLNEKFGGTVPLRILIEGEADGVLKEASVLRAISELEEYLAQDKNLHSIYSIADHVRRVHQTMNRGDPEFYRIPNNSRLIGQYLLMYTMAAGPDGLSAVVDASYRWAVIRALSRTDSYSYSRELIQRLEHFVDQQFRGLPVKVGLVGGTMGVLTAMNETVVLHKILNVLQVATIIFILSGAVFRSAVAGLLVLLPLMLALVFNLGLMGWGGIWLDMSTAAFTALGVSIGADFAIYVLFRLREELRRVGDVEQAVRTTMRTAGNAVFFVSSAVVLGYLVLLFSGFSLWIRLGTLAATTIAVSALAAATLVPALVLVFRPKFLAPSVRYTV